MKPSAKFAVFLALALTGVLLCAQRSVMYDPATYYINLPTNVLGWRFGNQLVTNLVGLDLVNSSGSLGVGPGVARLTNLYAGGIGVSLSPTNYTAGATNVEQHLVGIDASIGALSVGGVPDGDKGDITVTGGVWGIDDGTITSNKLVAANVTPDKLSALTSADLRGKLSDESGTGAAIFAGGTIGAAAATTPSPGDNDTSVATSAFVTAAISSTVSSNLWQATNANLTTLATGEGGLLSAALTPTNANQFVRLVDLQEAVGGDAVNYFDVSSFASGFIPGGVVKATNWMTPIVPAQATNVSLTVSNGQYIAKFISTNTFSNLPHGLAVVELYVFENSAGSGDLSAEVYVINSVTKVEEFEFTPAPAFQSFPDSATPTLLRFSVPITDYSSTTNFHVAIKIKVQETGTDPTIRIVSGGSYPSHVSYNLASSSFVLKSGDTMTGALSNQVSIGAPILIAGTTNVADALALKQPLDADLTALAAGTVMGTLITNSASLGSPAIYLGTTNLAGALALKAPLASPVFTGTLTLPQSDDPDVSAAGHLSWDTDGWLRAWDGANQVAVGRKIVQIDATVYKPQDLDDAQRDALWIWSNQSGMSFIVTGWAAWSSSDDTDLTITEMAADGTSIVTVDAVTIATNGTGIYYGSDTTITSATIASGHILYLNFDDTDAPAQVKVTVFGYYDANVN